VTRRVARALLVSLTVVTWTSASMGVAASLVPSGAPSGNVEPTLDPVPAGTVAVVASSAPVAGRVAVIVQNGTTAPVRSVRVTALATHADGSRATKLTTQSVLPSTLAPDAIALGVFKFRPSDLSAGVTLSYKVKSGRAPSGKDPTSLDVGSFVLSPPLVGDPAQTLDVTVTNPSSHAVKGPVEVRVTCFGESARPAVSVDAKSKKSKLAAHASAHVVVKLHELCPSYLVAAKGQSVA
jgi:hypothetical protein